MKAMQIVGRLGQAIEVKGVGEGKRVANFSLALDDYNFSTKSKDTIWMDCTVWGTQADFLGSYASPGDVIAIKGEYQVERYDSKKYTDSDGNGCPMVKPILLADMGGVDLYSKLGGDAPADRGGIGRDYKGRASGSTPATTSDALTFDGEDDIPF